MAGPSPGPAGPVKWAAFSPRRPAQVKLTRGQWRARADHATVEPWTRERAGRDRSSRLPSSRRGSTRPELRLIECGVVYHPLPDRSDFRLESARPLYDAGHLPGAVFVDPIAELSDPASGLRFTLPSPGAVAEAFGRHGVGPGTFAVLYCRDHNIFAARLWWMLRSIGWDDAAVLNGGFVRWVAEGRPVTTDVRRHPPARLEAAAASGPLRRQGRGAPGARRLADRRRERALGRAARGPGRVSRTAARGGSPGSVSVSARALTDPATHAYLPPERIRAALEAAGDPARRGRRWRAGAR